MRTGEKFGFWLALAGALGLHAVLLLLPMTMQTADKINIPAQIELQLTTIYKEAIVPTLPEPEPDEAPIEPEPRQIPEPESTPDEPEKLESIVKTPETPSPRLIPEPPIRELDQHFEEMTPEQKVRLTNTILSQPFISEESAADKIFGRPLVIDSREPRKEFHYPTRPNMMTMLDQPVPDLPFAYTPDLIYFAYDPGVKGDLQRFWDVITPEFGWRTNNGTEFRCKWVLIIVGCGWK